MSIVFRDFGTAYLAAPLTVGGVSLTVDNSTWLPSLAAGDYFYLVLQKYSDRSYVEIVKCTATSGNVLTIVRAQSGTAARSFAIGDYAELRLTSDGFSEFVAQGLSAKMDKTGGDFSGLVRFLAPSSARFDLVRSSDNVAAGVVLDFNVTEGHRTIVGGGTGSNVVTPSLLLRPNGYGSGTGQVRIDSAGLVDGVAFEMRAAQQTKSNSLVRYDTLSSYVLGTRAINNHALTSDFSITADEVFSAGATVNANARFQASDFQYRQADGAYGVRLAVSSAIGYLQSGKVDNTAAEQKLYLTGWMGNPLALFKVYSENPLYRRKAGVDYPLYDALNKPAIADVVGLSDALLQAGGSPVLAAVWVQLRTAMWNGHVAADGQTLNRADYPDAWAAIQAGKVPVVTDAEWLADPYKRASFTAGDGTTTFRLPDYNGKSAGSVGRVYLGGDGLNSAVTNGIIQGDAIRNIKGRLHASSYSDPRYSVVTPAFSEKGAFSSVVDDGLDTLLSPPLGTSVVTKAVQFDASAVVPTAADNHPTTATGCWAVKLFGAVQNAGSIDAAGLATQMAEAQSKISALETKTMPDCFYGSGIYPVYIAAGGAAAFKATTARKVRGIVPSATLDSFTIKKAGWYKVSAAYQLEPTAYVQNSILVVARTGVASLNAMYVYAPANSTSPVMALSAWSDVYYLNVNDVVSFQVFSANSTAVKLWPTGYIHIEELL